jgi:hypothetical protein
MKTALDQTGSPIEAAPGAPEQAICPHCGGVVNLRQRSSHHLSSNVSFFWRHRDHDNVGCPARFAVTIRKASGAGRMGDSPRLATEA